MYIYILTNNINGKQYVGQSTKDPESSYGRIYHHFYRHSRKTAISNAVQKHGKDNFSYKVLYFGGISQESLDNVEKWKIKQLNTMAPNGYNLRTGGGGGTFSDETKNKLSESCKGRTPWNKGKKNSDKTRKKISASLKGHTPWNKGKKHSDKTRAKISASLKGRSGNIGMTGKKHSDKTRAKMSDSRKGKRKVTKPSPLQIPLFDD